MRLHVCPEVGSVCKLLSTVSTPKGLLPGVTPGVSLQQPGPGESLATNCAGVGQAVGQHVHGQGGHAHVQLVTDVASLRCLRGHEPVCLLVSGQVGAGGELFSTLGAGVFLSARAG